MLFTISVAVVLLLCAAVAYVKRQPKVHKPMKPRKTSKLRVDNDGVHEVD